MQTMTNQSAWRWHICRLLEITCLLEAKGLIKCRFEIVCDSAAPNLLWENKHSPWHSMSVPKLPPTISRGDVLDSAGSWAVCAGAATTGFSLRMSVSPLASPISAMLVSTFWGCCRQQIISHVYALGKDHKVCFCVLMSPYSLELLSAHSGNLLETNTKKNAWFGWIYSLSTAWWICSGCVAPVEAWAESHEEYPDAQLRSQRLLLWTAASLQSRFQVQCLQENVKNKEQHFLPQSCK